MISPLVEQSATTYAGRLSLRQDRHRRQSADPEPVPRPRHPHVDDLQGRQARRDPGRRGQQGATQRLHRSQLITARGGGTPLQPAGPVRSWSFDWNAGSPDRRAASALPACSSDPPRRSRPLPAGQYSPVVGNQRRRDRPRSMTSSVCCEPRCDLTRPTTGRSSTARPWNAHSKGAIRSWPDIATP